MNTAFNNAASRTYSMYDYDLQYCDQVHVWYLLADDYDPRHSLQNLGKLLTAEEEARRAGYVFEKDRHQFLLSRYLVKNVLSTYFPCIAPEEWQFAHGQYGRPYIANVLPVSGVSFNLSHTRNVIVCAVSMRGTVGVDVEYVRNDRHLQGIVDRFFSPDEVRAFRGTCDSRRDRLFYQLWTLKEAFIKAEGKGLSLDLDTFWFDIAEAHIDFTPEPVLGVGCNDYQFAQTRLWSGGRDTGCEMSVALRWDGRTSPMAFARTFHFDRDRFHTVEDLPFVHSR